MDTYSNDSPQNPIKLKPIRNRTKTISRLFEPIVTTLHKIKTYIPIRRYSRVHGKSPMSIKKNPLRKKGGKTRKNRKSKRKL